MNIKPALLPEPFTIELPASDLPEHILARFPERPSPAARFAVTIEPAQTEMEKIAALRRDIEEGLADVAAGRVSDGDAVFARLKVCFPDT